MAESGWRRFEIGASQERGGALTTFIDHGCEFEGRLVLEQSIRIDGEFRGEVETSESVILGSGAAVEAKIRARTVVVHGAVAGDLTASREVVLHPTARVTGNVETPSLVVERGAYLSGETRMFRPELEARQRAATDEDSSARAASVAKASSGKASAAKGTSSGKASGAKETSSGKAASATTASART